MSSLTNETKYYTVQSNEFIKKNYWNYLRNKNQDDFNCKQGYTILEIEENFELKKDDIFRNPINSQTIDDNFVYYAAMICSFP